MAVLNRWESEDNLAGECQALMDRFWDAVGGRKGLGKTHGRIFIKGGPEYISKLITNIFISNFH